jgi:uncharacterized protein YbjT (DUF2867 family)
MKVLISTPTGTQGSHLLRELIERNTPGLKLRVLARNPGKLAGQLPRGVELLQGAHDDPAALDRALEGVDAVFWCQPDDITAADVHGSYRAFAEVGRDAFRRAGTPRVVALSAAGGRHPGFSGPISALRVMEETLAESGAALRFLRCGSFYENLVWQVGSLSGEGAFYYTLDGEKTHPMVAAGDVARAGADFLTDEGWKGTSGVNLLGPTPLSYNSLAATLSRVLGREISYVALPREAYREALFSVGYQPAPAEGLLAMFDAIEAMDWEGLAGEESYPCAITFESWAESHFRHALDKAAANP